MARIQLGLGSVVCLALLAAQPPAQQNAEKGTVEGSVVDASTGQPIERALVMFEQASQFTGPDGRFVFQTTEARRYGSVAAVRPGYERGRDTAMPNQARQSLTVKLKRYAAITGKVLNEDGEPVLGLRVQAYRRTIESGRAKLSTSSFWTTDDLGSFRLAEMPAGQYLVRVIGRRGSFIYLGEPGARIAGSSEAYIAQYYPGVVEQSAAQVLKLEPGQVMQLEFTVPSRPAFSIRGRILNHVPYQPVTLELSRQGELPMGNRVAVNSANGEFEMFDVPSGQFELSATRKIKEAEERGRIAVQVGNASMDGVKLTLTRPVDIELLVHGAETELRSGFFDMALTPRESGRGDEPILLSEERSVKRGFRGVWPGRYRIDLPRHLGERYVTAVTSDGVDLLHEDLTVTEGSAPAPIEIQLAPGPAQLDLTVLAGGKPAVSAQVLLFSGQGQSVRTSDCDPKGRTSVRSLAPGTYSLLALPEGLAMEYENPQVMERFANQMKRVDLRAGAKEILQLELVQEDQN